MKAYTKDQTKELMLLHWPKCTDVQYNRWYCNCGAYLDYLDQYGRHLDTVFRKNKGVQWLGSR